MLFILIGLLVFAIDDACWGFIIGALFDILIIIVSSILQIKSEAKINPWLGKSKEFIIRNLGPLYKIEQMNDEAYYMIYPESRLVFGMFKDEVVSTPPYNFVENQTKED